MFETVFDDPRLIERHRAAPLLEERLRYLRSWAESGATPRTLQDIAGYLVRLCELVDSHDGAQVSLDTVVEAVGKGRKRFIGHAHSLGVHQIGSTPSPASPRLHLGLS